MEKRKVSATADPAGKNLSATIEVNVPTTVAEAISMWGEDVCLSHLLGSVVINIQGAIRRKLIGTKEVPPKDQKTIAAELSNYKPTKSADRMDPVERMAQKIRDMSPEKKAAILAMLSAKAKIA